MSYNIDSVEILKREGFRIKRAELDALRAKHEGDSPEVSFLTDEDECFEVDGDYLNVEHLWWYGEGSGHAEDVLLQCLERFEGSADLVITWEGGDSFSGLRLRDGRVTRHEVVMTLGPEEK